MLGDDHETALGVRLGSHGGGGFPSLEACRERCAGEVSAHVGARLKRYVTGRSEGVYVQRRSARDHGDAGAMCEQRGYEGGGVVSSADDDDGSSGEFEEDRHAWLMRVVQDRRFPLASEDVEADRHRASDDRDHNHKDEAEQRNPRGRSIRDVLAIHQR